jgi:hypothetical protein
MDENPDCSINYANQKPELVELKFIHHSGHATSSSARVLRPYPSFFIFVSSILLPEKQLWSIPRHNGANRAQRSL